MILGFVSIFVYNFRDFYSVEFASVFVFCWGVQESGPHILQLSVCGFQFESKSVPFAVLKSVKALGMFVFIILESFLGSKESYTIYFTLTAIFGVFSWLLFYFKFEIK
jgi:hypothetical protein